MYFYENISKLIKLIDTGNVIVQHIDLVIYDMTIFIYLYGLRIKLPEFKERLI